MLQPKPAIAELKNQWLFQHVNVEFPTPESLAGRELYKQKLAEKTYCQIGTDVIEHQPLNLDDVYLVDFHRLTVAFSLLQAKQWDDQAEQNLVVEFLSQIIYSAPCDLYLAFSDGEAIAAAIVTTSDKELLISDLSFNSERATALESAFISALVQKTRESDIDYSDIYLEK